MSNVGDKERVTQNRVVQLFQNKLGYAYLGNWQERLDNSNIEENIVRKYLSEKGYSEILIGKALHQLRVTANNDNESLYTNSKNVYGLLRYGVKVKADVGENYETVELIDWKHPLRNQFAIAEEVTVRGKHDKRPDIVLYVNGIALGVLELKRSTVSVGDGIRQSIVNQQEEFIQSFFSTIQFGLLGMILKACDMVMRRCGVGYFDAFLVAMIRAYRAEEDREYEITPEGPGLMDVPNALYPRVTSSIPVIKCPSGRPGIRYCGWPAW